MWCEGIGSLEKFIIGVNGGAAVELHAQVIVL